MTLSIAGGEKRGNQLRLNFILIVVKSIDARSNTVDALRCNAYNDDPLRIARVAVGLPQSEAVHAMALQFAALGHPVRLSILAAISVEPLCVCELSCLLDMSSPSLMHHLRILADAGYLTTHKVGKFAEYRPTQKHSPSISSLEKEKTQ